MRFVANLFSPIPVAKNSHSLGWSAYWARKLDAKIIRDLSIVSKKDTLYIDHGVNFNGSLNLFGGFSDHMFSQLSHLISVSPKLVSLDVEMPKYVDFLSCRIGKQSSTKSLDEKFCSQFKAILDKASCRLFADDKPTWVTFGDSHTIAYADRLSEIHRTNGLTLFRFLQDYKTLLPDFKLPRYSELKKLTIVLGSIDIRHHIFRQPDPWTSVRELVSELDTICRSLQKNFGFDIELGIPVPVEHEGRRVPTTGYYKGSPFFGSREERLKMTVRMGCLMSQTKFKIVSPPIEWYKMSGEDYAASIMERVSSVHISPVYYRSGSILGDWNSSKTAFGKLI